MEDENEDNGERGALVSACRPNARSTSVLGVRTDWASLKADVRPTMLGLGDARGGGIGTGVGPREVESAKEGRLSLCVDGRSTKLHAGVSGLLLNVVGVSDLVSIVVKVSALLGILSRSPIVANFSATGSDIGGRDGTGGTTSSCEMSEESCLLRDLLFSLNMNRLRLDASDR